MNLTTFLRSVICTCVCLSTAPASAQPPGKPSTFDGLSNGPQGFSVVLVLGDTKGATTVDDSVPPAARKALADMKDFLPYKSYRLLDAQWILGSTHASTRLRGVDEQEYQLTLRSGVASDGQLRVGFQLLEPGSTDAVIAAAEDGQRRAQLVAMQDKIRQLEQEAAGLRARGGAESQRTLQAINAQIAEVRRQMTSVDKATTNGRSRGVIDTSFTMDIGETVVVGTSRVRGGDKALIALLTAVPKATAPKRED
jgi:hypothetical protein